jgi:NAD(P)H-hydrate epimerase
VLDADALTPASVAALAPVGVPAVLTPHPLEAARLLETDLSVVLADRVAAATAIAARYRAVTVLKGRNPVIASPDASEPALILDLTAPALSAGGTGDVLAGVIGALIAQGCSLRDAAALGAELHGRAGLAAGLETADRGVLASEVADAVPRVLAALLSGWGG